MEADANMRELLGLTKGTTSEECYRIWERQYSIGIYRKKWITV